MDTVTIGSGDGLSRDLHRVITRTNDDLLSIKPLRATFNEIWFKRYTHFFEELFWGEYFPKYSLQHIGHIVVVSMWY